MKINTNYHLGYEINNRLSNNIRSIFTTPYLYFSTGKSYDIQVVVNDKVFYMTVFEDALRENELHTISSSNISQLWADMERWLHNYFEENQIVVYSSCP